MHAFLLSWERRISLPESARTRYIIQGNAAGTQTVQQEPGGAVRAEYSYNDRGRGDHIVATWKLDADGVPIEYEGRGNDYMKAPVEERFEIKDGKATWKNRSERGEQGGDRSGVLPPGQRAAGILRRARACAAQSARITNWPSLPAGEASIEEAGRVKRARPERNAS